MTISTNSGIKSKIICFVLTILICLIQNNNSFSQHWEKLGSGTNSGINCLFADTINNSLFVGGNFTTSGGILTSGIAKWDGNNWYSLDSGQIPFPVKSITKYNNNIYAGGFSYEKIARYNGSNWESVSGGLQNGVINKLLVQNGELYVFGNFDSVAGIPAICIAKYNGVNWSSVANQFTDPSEFITISNAVFFQGDLIVSGNFNSSNGLNEIARWDGNTWHSLNGGILGDAIVDALAVYKNALYVGGIFTKIDGNQGNYIMKWDGQNWSEVGNGVMGINGYNGQIHDMLVFENELYVVGVFTYAGGVPIQYIAKWNGTKWCGLGGVFNDRITSIVSFDNTIYLGGGFQTINNDTVNHIAKWIGGNYTDTCSQTYGVTEILNNNEISIFPNPVNTLFEITTYNNTVKELKLYSLEGKLLIQKIYSEFSIKIDTAQLPQGMYIIEVKTSKEAIYKKLLILH